MHHEFRIIKDKRKNKQKFENSQDSKKNEIEECIGLDFAITQNKYLVFIIFSALQFNVNIGIITKFEPLHKNMLIFSCLCLMLYP